MATMKTAGSTPKPKRAGPTEAGSATPKPAAASPFMKAMTISPALAAVIGAAPMPRTEVTRQLWVYIKQHGLQDAKQRTMINADAKLLPIFQKPQVSMFEMTKLVNAHLS